MLEQKIEALTVAVEKLTAALNNIPAQQVAGSKPAQQVAGSKPAQQVAGSKPAQQVAGSKPAAAEPAERVEVPEAGETLSYDDVKAPFLKFIEVKGYEAAAALLARFAVAKLPALPPEKFSAMLSAIREAS